MSDAHLGRVLSLQRRRQLSQGKQALGGAAEPPEETQSDADDTVAGRLERGGRPSIVPTVKVPPPQGGPLVTRQRLGAAVQITGDEAGRGLPVSGSQHVLADGSRTAPGAASKVGLVRTAHGLVVSGSTVRSRVAVTGDEFGEHLLITGEADQKLDDDLTPRRGDTYRAAQFPRRSDPHGTSAVSRQPNHRPGASASSGGEPVRPPEISLSGLGITGTAVGRSGRVTGDEAGACRVLTGDQYQGFAVDSSECGGTGGGTAPAAHSSWQRLDPVTGRKVTESQTVGGQPVTGPDVQHRHHLHGGELRRPVSGTAYQEPSGDSHPGEPDAAGSPTQALVAQVDGMAVTGNVPRYSEAVTGIERGRHSSVTGTSYHQNMRSAQPVNVGGFYAPAAFPVAVAAPGKGHSDASTQDLDPGLTASRAPASSTPGQITGSFAIGQGKVTGNQEFLPLRGPDRGSRARTVTGEGSVAGRTVTGSSWTAHELVTGTEGHIAAGRNPSEGDRGSHAWAGADKFKDRGRTEAPSTHLTGQAGSNKKVGAKVTLSGGAQA
ncbi:MAG: CsoS2 family carboxysome shell protein [Actinobacteria bacterium]|nr:CsoS2 family carboxysome shell protein [Actinomycetota bacterium]